MKKILLTVLLATTCMVVKTSAQTTTSTGEITPKNSWLKAGLTVGLPVGDASNVSSFTAGIELRGQVMSTNHWGFGLASGYDHFFPKSGFSSFGEIPLGVMIRYYPEAKGFFAGIDGGYTFLTNFGNTSGGAYIKPQIGYHDYNWNFYALYNHVFVDGSAVQNVGIGATYNLRFK
ncbi:hypothetical protein [Ferruginibacter albus]|uniref:hypothetical protein n=1 Tax=Ferruginibacter albus TaxID=2875540 RepID=UPI001CC753A9|nr:hypothetical protein [Ferruginibacter albus]UAY51093.1 hypothetical protein K9M53_10880 [Ferruginibacter albus]